MKKLRVIFRQPEFPFLLFPLSIFLFIAPFQRNADKTGVGAVFLYLFLAWGGISLLLLFMSRELSEKSEKVMRAPENNNSQPAAAAD